MMMLEGFYPRREQMSARESSPADQPGLEYAPSHALRHVGSVAISILLLFPSPTVAGRAPQHAASSTACVGLASDMDHLSKSMAMNFAEGIADNSAVRATMRETEYNSLLTRVRLTMDLMRDNHCETPRSVPTGAGYTSDALLCRTDMLKAEVDGTGAPSSCDQTKWVSKAP